MVAPVERVDRFAAPLLDVADLVATTAVVGRVAGISADRIQVLANVMISVAGCMHQRSHMTLSRMFALVLIAGCATSTPDIDDTEPTEPSGSGAGDSPTGDPDEDEEDATCGFDTHTCGTSCVPDTENTPELGCMYGCGTPCPGAENGTATCTASGACDITCDGGYAKVGGECQAFSCTDVGYACGDYYDADGTMFSCGTCSDGVSCGFDNTCDVPADGMEANDTEAAASYLGDFNDADNVERWFERLSIHDEADVDWFTFRVKDGFDSNNPDVSVSLTKRGTDLGWLESWHELTVWFKCDSADEGTTVKCGEWYTEMESNNANSSTLGKGCTVDARYVVWARFEPKCSGTDESGTAYVRVRKRYPPRGDLYDLRVVAK